MSTEDAHLSGADDIADDFAEMALRLHDQNTLLDTVEQVLAHAVKSVPCSYAGILLVHRAGRVETVAATHDVVTQVDRIQVDVGEGPHLECGGPPSVLVRDVAAETRWPTWAARVAEHGVASMMGVLLHTSDATIGSLNFYGVEPGAFADSDVRVAEVLGRHAGVALDSARDTESLWHAIDSRHVIGQAQGILMERYAVGPDAAFAILRRHSQDHNVKLRAVAEQLVGTRSLEGLEDRLGAT